jgi:hypothetical protein
MSSASMVCNWEIFKMFVHFILYGGFGYDAGGAGTLPAPLYKKKTTQNPKLRPPVHLCSGVLVRMFWVLLEDPLTRFREARWFRLFNFKNGREKGIFVVVDQSFSGVAKWAVL